MAVSKSPLEPPRDGASEQAGQPAPPAARRARATSTRPAPPTSKTRSGLGAQVEQTEVWTDEDWAKATGLFQILDEQGRVADRSRLPQLAPAELVQMYRGMLRIRTLDERFLPMQRQGRVGFYIGASGQEAGIIGGAHAIGPQDYFVPGLRETGAALYRGFPLRAHVAQMFGNANDLTLGRQLPCHSGSRASHHIIMSSCVSSQLPHATGIAWAAKVSGDKTVALGYMGDGGTSEEDFHVAMNFAAVFKVPVVFVCQNNQWAISTPLELQTVSETIAVKGLAYGIPSIRVDGNDVLAVYAAVKAAVDRARAGGGPTFIENLTYRIGPHSSSDDPTRYRADDEPKAWREKDPLRRFRTFLAAEGVLGEKDADAIAADLDREIREAIALEEKAPPPPLRSMIEDVYAKPNWILEEQLAELERVRARRGRRALSSGRHE